MDKISVFCDLLRCKCPSCLLYAFMEEGGEKCFQLSLQPKNDSLKSWNPTNRNKGNNDSYHTSAYCPTIIPSPKFGIVPWIIGAESSSERSGEFDDDHRRNNDL